MSTIRAYLGTPDLTDVGYRFYTQNTPATARVASGIVDEGAGWYSAAGVTLAGDHVRWDSISDTSAVAREDLSLRFLVAAGVDPWSVTIPGDYAEGTAGALLAKLDVGEPEDPVVVVAAPAAAEQTVGYIVTRDGHGASASGVPIYFKLTDAPGVDSYSTQPFSVFSDADGLVQISLRKGAVYDCRRGSTADWTTFTAANVADSFALPQILGTP